jgi:hypothetical protein
VQAGQRVVVCLVGQFLARLSVPWRTCSAALTATASKTARTAASPGLWPQCEEATTAGGGLDVEQEEKRRWLGVVDVIGWSVSGKPQRDALLRNNGISLCSRPA